MTVDDRRVRVPPARTEVTVVGGEGVVVDLRSGRYFALNATGLLLWEALVEGCRRSRLAELLQQQFGLEPGEARAAADAFLTGLEAQDLVEPDEQ